MDIFRDCKKILTEEYYQMRLDESFRMLRYNDVKESKSLKLKI